MIRVFYVIAALSLLSACSPKKTKPVSGVKNGLVKVYRDDGRLHQELMYENDTLQGLSKVYHPDGKLYLETEWARGKRHGITKQYYESGILYSETQYDSGKITGILKRYHKDGKLKSEMPYKKGVECAGLKEYILNGDPRPHYPSIVIKPENRILSEGEYALHLSVSERVRKVTFYLGNLRDNCLHSDLEQIYSEDKYKAKFVYSLSPGQFAMETVNFIAKIETIAGNVLVVQKSFNVAIERKF